MFRSVGIVLLVCVSVSGGETEGVRELSSEDPTIRLASAKTLGVYKLRVLLQDGDPLLRKNAAWALGQLGMAAKEAIPSLRAALKDKDLEVRAEAAQALKSIQNAEAAAKAPPPPTEQEKVQAKLNAHWSKVPVEIRPATSTTVSFEFKPEVGRIVWETKVGDGVVKYRWYNVYFYNGTKRIREAYTILRDMKRNTSVEDVTYIDPLEVTRVEVVLESNR